jgi:large subunit ribosomal protein L21
MATKATIATEKIKKTTVIKTVKKVVAPVATLPSEIAVIATGGKQYTVTPGQTLKIEKMPGEFKLGDAIIFDKVLLVDDGLNTTIGTPYITGAQVLASFQGAGRAQKLLVMKYKQKSRYLKTNGHRQPFFTVKIESFK